MELDQTSERFQIVSRLGAGATGIVYEALDHERNTRVALKALRNINATTVSQLKNEFRTLADLRHANLVFFDELVEEEGQWLLAMELVDGVDFMAWVRPDEGRVPLAPLSDVSPTGVTAPEVSAITRSRAGEGRFDEARLRAGLAQLAEALDTLHRHGKVHRDVKPANVRVTPDGRVVLLDLGLAADTGYDASEVVGTAYYMAPEQAAGHPPDPASDWYAFGVILFEALTGTLPFFGTPLDVLLQKQQGPAPGPASLAGDLPPDLVELCSALISTGAGDRPRGREVIARLSGRAPRLVRPPTAPIIGRATELAALHASWAEVTAGRPAKVVIVGEPGVGKTSLVARFFTDLAASDEPPAILAGRCHERESIPYKGMDGVIDALAAALCDAPPELVSAVIPEHAALLGAVFPVLRRVPALDLAATGEKLDPQEHRARVFEGLRELFARLAERRLLVLSIDDLQWADRDGLALLRHLTAPPAPPLLVITTCRTRPAVETAEVAAAIEDFTVVQVDNLSPDEAVELARCIASVEGIELPSAQIARGADESHGHPMFLAEIIRLAADGRDALPLNEALAERVQALPELERRLLELVALAAAPLPQRVVADAAGIALGELAMPTSHLRTAHLLRSSGPRMDDFLEPYHDLVGVAVIAQLDDAGRLERHRALAAALERADTMAEARALHWDRAGEPARAAAAAIVAARRAAELLAFDRAAALLGFALARPLPPGEIASHLHEQRGDALANAGAGAAAADAYLAAADGADQPRWLDLGRRAAEQLFRGGEFDRGLAALEPVLAAVGMRVRSTDAGALASLAVRRAQVRLRGLGFRERSAGDVSPELLARTDVCWSASVGLSSDPIRAAHFQAKHLLLALRAGEPYRVARAVAMEIGFSATGGSRSMRRTTALMRTASELAERVGNPHAIGLVAGMTGLAHYLHGEWLSAREECDRAERILRDRCTNVFWELDMAQLFAIEARAYLGQIRELARRVPIRLAEAYDRGDRFALAMMSSGIQTMTWLAPDRPDEARARADRALETWSRAGFHLAHFLNLFAQISIDVYRGDPAAALERFDQVRPAMARALIIRIQLPRIMSFTLRANAALGVAASGRDRDALLRQTHRAARALERERIPWAQPFAAQIRGEAAAIRGELDAAVTHLRRAAAGFAELNMAMHVAAVERHLGALVGGDEGAQLVTGADRLMRNEGIMRPAQIALVFGSGWSTT